MVRLVSGKKTGEKSNIVQEYRGRLVIMKDRVIDEKEMKRRGWSDGTAEGMKAREGKKKRWRGRKVN